MSIWAFFFSEAVFKTINKNNRNCKEPLEQIILASICISPHSHQEQIFQEKHMEFPSEYFGSIMSLKNVIS